MPKVVSVDAAIRGNMPYVEFRGRLYELRDFTLREQVELGLEMREKQEAAEAERDAALAAVAEAEEAGEVEEEFDMEELRARADESLDHLHAVYGESFARALVDFPAELIEEMTEREILVLQQAIQEAREITFPVSAESRDEVDPKKVGKATR